MSLPDEEVPFFERTDRLSVLLSDAQAAVKRVKRDSAGILAVSWLEHSLKDLPTVLNAINKASRPSPKPTLEIDTSDATLFENRQKPKPKNAESKPAHRESMPAVRSESIPIIKTRPPSERSTSSQKPPSRPSSQASGSTHSRRSSLFSNESRGSLDRRQVPEIVPRLVEEPQEQTPRYSQLPDQLPQLDLSQQPLFESPLMRSEAGPRAPRVRKQTQDDASIRGHGARRHDRRTPAIATPPPPKLDSKRIFRCVANALLEENGAASAANLLLVSKKARDAVQPLLYDTVTVSKPSALASLMHTVEGNSRIATLVHRLIIRPLPGNPSDHLPLLNRLLTCLPRLRVFDEDWPSEDWDILTKTDYPAIEPVQLGTLVSRSGWFEIGALVSVLSSQDVSLRSLTIGGAVVDREWQGSHLRSAQAIPPISTLTYLDLSQVMHEDTLVILLRLCPALVTLKLGLQSVGTTDDDTSRTSIVEALKQVSKTLRHFTLRAPTRPTVEAQGLLETCVDVLPHLEQLEWSERTKEGQPQHVPLCTRELLLRLPPSLRRIQASGLVSIGTKDVLELLSRPDLIPVLDELDLSWSDMAVTFSSNERNELVTLCRDFGITARLERL